MKEFSVDNFTWGKAYKVANGIIHINMKEIFLGENRIKLKSGKVRGEFVEIENEKFYKISHYHQMADFFMTIVSDSDHWMFLSSNGSLSAGRKNPDNAIFPYYTVDKIHDYRDLTGSKTWCLVEKANKVFLWEPFTKESAKIYDIERFLYKSIYGNKVIFEEANNDLGIVFRYGWYNSSRFGWIKKSMILNQSNQSVKINVLDGLRGVLPYGVDAAFQNSYSNLIDAYRKSELLENSKLGIYTLGSIPVDKAEPSEALKSTAIWPAGLDVNTRVLISDKQVENFISGITVETETDIRASRGSYYINNEIVLAKKEKKEWYIIAELNQDSADVNNLNTFITTEKNKPDLIEKDISEGTANLVRIVASSDGLQMGNEDLCYARHFSNTLFNVMRGGVYANQYNIQTADFICFIEQANKDLSKKFISKFKELPGEISYFDLMKGLKKHNNSDLERIGYEYLPLTFSRRHGDPSRPWNRFSIETRNSDGTVKLNYEGNWRDIFQNWEALNISFPGYIEGIICKFLNATTADGYNPYRITRNGIDWEKVHQDDPWAYVGYWGDHQIIYLQKLLEQSNEFHPGFLDELLTKEIFVYANVPYRIKPFEEIARNPKETIIFDHELDEEVELRADSIGSDGKLLFKQNGEIIKANLLEKIVVTLLAKLSNFIPEAGIWLTTQRPEWNDANNALVGNGVSMVTLYYLRRFIKFWENKLSTISCGQIHIAEEIKIQFENTFTVFAAHEDLLETGFTDRDRYEITSRLGIAAGDYREKIYNGSFSGKKSAIETGTLIEFLQLVLKYIDQSIQKNKREDGLYHAYNLIAIQEKGISIRYLYEMLEGQVAVLSSGCLEVNESLAVLNALKQSSLFRHDQYSYLLYPDRHLPRFTEKNNIPEPLFNTSELLQKLIRNNNISVIRKDNDGRYHFNGTLRNAAVLDSVLHTLDEAEYGQLVRKEKELILAIYEKVFDHQSFTGRSGTFFGYEGLGSIYWHMVSKLLLAVQENYFKAVNEKADEVTLGKLKEHYYEIKAGIGLYKTPDVYGAFPTDAYSHSPANEGVKQPGLTGQVKEDIITRFGETGIHIKNGRIRFDTSLLNKNELLLQEENFNYLNLENAMKTISLKAKELAITFCQLPIIFKYGSDERINIVFTKGKKQEISGNELPKEISQEIFNRTGEIELVVFNSPVIT